MDILCVGQLVTDIIAAGVNYRGLCDDADTQRVGKVVVRNGGDCMNVAIDLAKLGCNVGFSGKIGEDSFGDYLSSIFKQYHIDIRGLRVSKEVATAAVMVLVNPQGQRKFLYFGGTNDSFGTDDIDASLLEACSHVHVGGTYLLPLLDGAGSAALFAQAKAMGKTTSMDVTWDTTGRWLSVIEDCLPHLDLFMPSEIEAAQITGYSHPEQMANFLLGSGVKTVVIKLGAKGSYLKSGKEAFYQPAFAVDTVDTTGAGDSFVAGFLARYIKGCSLRECAVFASAVAAHCVKALGATDGVPDEKTVTGFINA